MHRPALLLAALLLAACTGDGMVRGLLITGDGRVVANNAKNARAEAERAIRDSLEPSLGPHWRLQAAIKELPEYDEDWYWPKLSATMALIGSGQAADPATPVAELEKAARDYLLQKVGRRDALSLTVSRETDAIRFASLSATAAAQQTVVVIHQYQPAAGPATAAPAAPAGPRTYLVQPGDTLGDLSAAFYGSPQHWRIILDANPGLRADALAPGTSIVIPAKP